jgi:hypothetical protein
VSCRFKLHRIMTRGEPSAFRVRMAEIDVFGPRYKSGPSIWVRTTYYKRRAWRRPAQHVNF